MWKKYRSTTLFAVVVLVIASTELYGAFGLDNNSGENQLVCLVEADETTVRWTWKNCNAK
jgi:hypothetical protein